MIRVLKNQRLKLLGLGLLTISCTQASVGGSPEGGSSDGGSATAGVTPIGGALSPAGVEAGVTAGMAAGTDAGAEGGASVIAGTQAGSEAGVSAGTEAGAQGGVGGEEPPTCDVAPVLERNSCSAGGCHAAPIQGNLDLSGDDLGERLLNAPAHAIGCEGRRLIDGRDWTKSLLLTAIGAESALMIEGDTCAVSMPPLGFPEMSSEDKECLSTWVERVASLDPGEPTEPAGPPPSLASALRKVKTLIQGGEVTEAELAQAEAEGLQPVIQSWASGEAFEAKLLEFFTLTLQQKFTTNEQNQFGRLRSHRSRRGQLERAMQEVIPRTALELVTTGQPFDQIATTRRFMMNTASMVTLLYPDQSASQLSELHFVSGDASEVPSSLAQQASQKRWYIEGLTGTCELRQRQLLEMFNGFINDNRCAELTNSYRFPNTPLEERDFTDWRWVEVSSNTSASDEEVTPFYDVATLRTLNAITTRLPRVGYYTSNAFMNQWPTNVDNQFRVTVNQALLAGLHIGFASSEGTEPIQTDALDAEHAEPGSECYGCHRQLDPMRVYFGAAYNADYRLPTDANDQEALFNPLPRASFAFRGETNDGGRVGRLGQNIANHARWSSAWVQKVCLFVNSPRCDETDPLFIELRDRFEADDLLLPMLIDVLSSPLTTGLEPVSTREAHPIVSVTRRDQLCGLLAERTRVSDICDRNVVRRSLGLIPVDSYARGAVDFTQPALSSPFYFAAVEAICEAAATVTVTRNSEEFSFTAPEATLAKLVTHLMSVQATDARHAPLLTALTQHYEALISEGVVQRDALRSAFTLACLSPDVMGIGL